MKKYVEAKILDKPGAIDEIVGKADYIKEIAEDIVTRGVDDLSDKHLDKLAELVEDMYQIAGIVKDTISNYS